MITNEDTPRVMPLPRVTSAMHLKGAGDVAMHSHEQAELVLILTGKVAITVDHHRLLGGPRTVFLLPPAVAHDQLCVGRWRSICVLFSRHEGIICDTPRVLDCTAEVEICGWLQDLSDLFTSKRVIPEIVCDGILLTILSAINHVENNKNDASALHPRLAAAVRFLEENAGAEVDAMALNRAAGVSYSHLNALFQERFQCAPLQYHKKLRMQRAKKLLLNPYATIGEVAAEVGFEDVNYFCRLFRKMHGVPPGKWRKATF